ncbi:unnamed protein product, partial [Amoebophrya sp. A120]|eukprot:GSA120T00019309001.1
MAVAQDETRKIRTTPHRPLRSHELRLFFALKWMDYNGESVLAEAKTECQICLSSCAGDDVVE